MKNIHQMVCKIEEYICSALLCIIVALSFITAIGRCINHPISWTIEVSQLLLAWLAFIGADMAFRENKIMGVDIFIRKLSQRTQTIIRIVMNVIIFLFLLLLIRYGYVLCISNLKRSYQTVGISYVWANASLPIAAVMMAISAILNVISDIQKLRGKDNSGEENAS